MSQNDLIYPSCNIFTYAHLLFIKSPRYKLQELLGKLLSPLEFIQLHMIVIIVWNEWFEFIFNIYIWNVKTLLLLFQDFILPHPSPIILLLCLCHIYHDFFLQYNYLIPLLHVAFSWDIGSNKCYQALPLATCHMNS